MIDHTVSPAAERLSTSAPHSGVVYTRAELEWFAPRPGNARKAQIWDGYMNAFDSRAGRALLAGGGITATPRRFTHFLAQVAHECGAFTIIEENLNYTGRRAFEVFGTRYFRSASDARRYTISAATFANYVYSDHGPRRNKLGNTQKNDGWHYRGRGILQHTGRWSYGRLRRAVGIDLLKHPDRLGDPLVALECAVVVWGDRDLNTHADQNRIGRITKRINGGYNGLEDRKQWLVRSRRVWGRSETLLDYEEASETLHEGSVSDEVKWLQRRLHELKFAPGIIDGSFGEETHLAVVKFQEYHGLRPDGIVGRATREKIKTAAPRYLGERAKVTGNDLEDMGHKRVQRARLVRRVTGGGLGLFGVAEAAQKTGALDALSGSVEKLTQMQTISQSLIGFVNFAADHLFWLAALTGAAAAIYYSISEERDAVTEHCNGESMGDIANG